MPNQVTVTIILDSNDLGQLLESAEVRRDQWRDGTHDTDAGEAEANTIATMLTGIIDNVHRQWDKQRQPRY